MGRGGIVRPIMGIGPEDLPKIRKLSRALETSGLGSLSRPSTARTARTACSHQQTFKPAAPCDYFALDSSGALS